jgi:hypothetical protein
MRPPGIELLVFGGLSTKLVSMVFSCVHHCWLGKRSAAKYACPEVLGQALMQ